MPAAERSFVKTVTFDSKIYVIGFTTRENSWANELDTVAGHWEALPSPKLGIYRKEVVGCVTRGVVYRLPTEITSSPKSTRIKYWKSLVAPGSGSPETATGIFSYTTTANSEAEGTTLPTVLAETRVSGTLTAFAALSQGKLLNMMRSAALLTPIAYLGRMPSLLIRAAAQYFFAEDIYFLGVREFIPKG
ncbi:hypothetical protein L484_009831 [Morus notabilis]|uniref:Uncharacterized protein n=1 Tax=Morus notabilis TaxID=981085 RepID=W9SF58_9ROSA|nr:hypothetical protein L484_009831 [Morus notabilis]